MCGRYVLALQPSEIRHRLERDGLNVHSSPPDANAQSNSQQSSPLQPSYNIAPTYIEPIYRAVRSAEEPPSIEYQLVPAKWGLVSNWAATKPTSGQVFKTINCRDDSLLKTSGLWNSVKHQRCIVPAQGFYEWLNTGKDKRPHYVKPTSGPDLLYFAGLWNSHLESGKTVITYTIITTSSGQQLRFLHDRMPVILRDAKTIRTWLDGSVRWSMDLQRLLKPLEGDGSLEVYPVAKEVGKVGRSEKRFTEKLELKAGIASFFKQDDQKNATGGTKREAAEMSTSDDDVKRHSSKASVTPTLKVEVKTQDDEPDIKVKHEAESEKKEIQPSPKRPKLGAATQMGMCNETGHGSPVSKTKQPTSNDGNQKITGFFTKQ